MFSSIKFKPSSNRKLIEQRIGISNPKLTEFCQKWHIKELAVFGSMLRNDFRIDSDLDFVASFTSEQDWGFFLVNYLAMETELSQLTGRKVDILDKKALETHNNWLFKKRVIESAELIYDSANVFADNIKDNCEYHIMSKVNRDEVTIIDIHNFAQEIVDFTEDLTKEDFINNKLVQKAIFHNITLIGEATRRLSLEFRNQYSAIPYQAIIGMRNNLVHEYHKVDLEQVWLVVSTEIPELINKINPLVTEIKAKQN